MYPGSFDAKAFGCLCSAGDNTHVVYSTTVGFGRQYTIVEACPIHGVVSWNVPRYGSPGAYAPTFMQHRSDPIESTTIAPIQTISPVTISKATDNYRLVRSRVRGLQLQRAHVTLDQACQPTTEIEWLEVPIEETD